MCIRITKPFYPTESEAASTAGYSDSGRGTMTHGTVADEEEVDHTFNLVCYHNIIAEKF